MSGCRPATPSPHSSCFDSALSAVCQDPGEPIDNSDAFRSEEHTSELQSQSNLVCRLLLEKKNEVNPVLFLHHGASPHPPAYSPCSPVAPGVVVLDPSAAAAPLVDCRPHRRAVPSRRISPA